MAKLFYGLIGYPLLNSFSPGYLNDRFRREAIDAEYEAFPLADISDFPAFLQAHRGLRGLNVTIPYKTAVLPFLEEIDKDAAAIGAVNCIAINEGKLIGYNTDWTGFRDSLRPLLQPHHTKALILGNGGAAKAVAYALRQMGIKYEVVSRVKGHGPYKAYSEVTPELLAEYTLLINTTPLGMAPKEDVSPDLPYEALSTRHLLYDLIYNPAETAFLKKGKAHDAIIKNGLEMLHLQADASWDIWKRFL